MSHCTCTAENSRLLRRIACGAILLAALAGCRMGRPSLVASPLSQQELEAEILAVVPLGTPRDAIPERLAAAGIQGSPGASDSIFYCDLWRRPTGEHWLLDVALYFDDEGRLYRVGRGQAETGVASDKNLTPPDNNFGPPSAFTNPRGADSDDVREKISTARDADRRTPFAEIDQ